MLGSCQGSRFLLWTSTDQQGCSVLILVFSSKRRGTHLALEVRSVHAVVPAKESKHGRVLGQDFLLLQIKEKQEICPEGRDGGCCLGIAEVTVLCLQDRAVLGLA